MEPLNPSERAAALGELDGWRAEGDRLVLHHDFGDFRTAMSFLVRMAFEAEDMGHHPEIRNVYGRVTLALTTHDAGNRLTSLDVELARRISRLME